MSEWKPPWPIASIGPTRVYGYDGKIDMYAATASEWRAFRMSQARARGTHTKAEWQSKLDAINKCVRCGRADLRLCKDHIIPVAHGGCDCIENLQPLCYPCNSSKGARIE
jgi:5-methylcytosine-specific restriction endonuclease McrA